MFLFPDTPQFETNLGEPLLLTPHIQRGNIEEARQDFIRGQSTVVSVRSLIITNRITSLSYVIVMGVMSLLYGQPRAT